MANKFPLIFDTTDGNRIKELPNGDNLNLQGSSIVDVVNISATGTIQADTIIVDNLTASGGNIAEVAITGDYNDLINKPVIFSGDFNDLANKPVIFSGSYTDLTNKPVIPTAISQLTNDAGYITNVTAIVPAANVTGLAEVAVTNDYNDLDNLPDVITRSEFTNGGLTIDVNNTGDLTGSVYSETGTLLVDHINGIVPATVLSGTASIDINSLGNSAFNQVSAVRLSAAITNIEDLTVEGNLLGDDSGLLIDGKTGRHFGTFLGTLNGDINRAQNKLTVTAGNGIDFVPTGNFNVTNAVDLALNASNDVQISGSTEVGIQSSSGTVQVTSFTETEIASSSSFINIEAFTNLTLQGGKVLLRPLGSAPASTKGAAGDKAGEIRFASVASTTYLYYCVSDYTNGVDDIWRRLTFTTSW